MKIDKLEMGTLKNHPENPRVIKDDQYEKLIEDLTQRPEMMEARPIITDGDLVIWAGNQRYKACQELGWKTIPTWVYSKEVHKKSKAHTKFKLSYEEALKNIMVQDNSSRGDWHIFDSVEFLGHERMTEFNIDMPDFKNDTFDFEEEEEMPKDIQPKNSSEAKGTENEYATFEIVMRYENKLKFIEVLNTIKSQKKIEQIEDAVMVLVNSYKTK